MNTPGRTPMRSRTGFRYDGDGCPQFYNGTSGTELIGKKLGIHAYGNVGRNVARIAKGFGMEIYAFDAFCPKEVIEERRCESCCFCRRTCMLLVSSFSAYSCYCLKRRIPSIMLW